MGIGKLTEISTVFIYITNLSNSPLNFVVSIFVLGNICLCKSFFFFTFVKLTQLVNFLLSALWNFFSSTSFFFSSFPCLRVLWTQSVLFNFLNSNERNFSIDARNESLKWCMRASDREKERAILGPHTHTQTHTRACDIDTSSRVSNEQPIPMLIRYAGQKGERERKESGQIFNTAAYVEAHAVHRAQRHTFTIDRMLRFGLTFPRISRSHQMHMISSSFICGMHFHSNMCFWLASMFARRKFFNDQHQPHI